ncbi:MAG TPA: mechanosensitive ion channel domain-containing protein [Steroidobacteraceae bacterium]|nr:mechanosensitive ion channel domain-containing protein [Steroidobacteraceae bacterium]
MKQITDFVSGLLTAANLAQVVALVVAAGVASLVERSVRHWYVPRTEPPMSTRIVSFEALAVTSPYIAAFLVTTAARSIISAAALSTELLDPMLRLIGALIVIRLLAYAVRRSVSPNNSLKRFENKAALAIWLLVAAQMLGWLDYIVSLLDSVGLATGKSRVTIWSVIAALFAVSICVIASLWVARWIDRRVSQIETIAPSTRIGIVKTSYAFFVGFGILLGLRTSGVDLTALTVFSGAIGLGLGFGLQAIAANFVSGFVLVMDKSIKPGDVISFTGTTGTSTHGFGWVEELRGRYIVIRDRDGVATLVPNQNVITNQVINWSYGHPKVRLRLGVRISYQDDAELALRLLLEAANDHPRILRDPAPVSRLMDFTDYGMETEVRFWIGDPAEGVNNVRSDVNRKIWALFRKHGITIPPAQREIRILDGSTSASTLAPRTRGPIEPTLDGQD